MTRSIVEIAFGYTLSSATPAWTDITQYANLARGIDITRGAQDELSETQPGTATLMLDNSDGRFTAERPSGAYYPTVKMGVPIRIRSVSADQNLVTNPSFEADTSDWSSSGTPTFARSTAQAKVGTASMLITWGAVSSQSVRTSIYGLDIGTTYTASTYVRVPAGDPAVRLKIASLATESDLASGSLSTLNDTWQQVTVTWTATETSAQLRVSPDGTPAAGDQVYVDAVQKWEGSSPLPLNHLHNGDFESNVANWASSGTPTFIRSTTRAYRGASSMQVTWGSIADQTITCDAMTGLVIGTTYTFSAYVWVPSGGTPVVLSVAGVGFGSPSTLFGQWQRITVTWTATATSHQVRLRHGSGVTPVAGQVWMDAAMVAEGSAPVDFTTLDGAQIHPRYFGTVNEWPLEWKGLAATATITCTDVFTWANLAKQLKPMLIQEVLLDQPTVYYPLTETSDSTSAGDLSGTASVAALALTQAGSGGTLEFGPGAGPNNLPAPVFTPASSTAGKYLSADLGPNFVEANSHFRVRAECWFSTSTNGRVLMGLRSDDSAVKLVILLESGTGKLALEKEQGAQGNQSYVFATPNLADGALHHMVYNEFENLLYVDGVSYSLTAFNGPDLRMLTVGGYQNARLWSGTLAHVALYIWPVSAATLSGHYATGTTGHVGEDADVRLARIASYAGLTVTTQGAVFDAMASQAELGRSALEHMREVEQTESGKLLSSRSTNQLLFQSRDLRYNPTPAVSLMYADLETDGVKYAYDNQKLTNDITASRPGGATQRIISQASINLYGSRPRDLSLIKNSDNAVADAANWMVSRYADPPPEVRQVPVEAYSMPLTTYRALLNADVSTVLGLTSLPDQAPASTATVTIEGYTERIGQNQHHIDFHTSRADTDTVWVLDDPTYSVLDSTTRLAY